MTKPSRRILTLTLVTTILVAGIAVVFLLPSREDDSVILKGPVIFRDSYVLSTCKLPNGKFCIWSYDFESGELKVHAQRDKLPRLFEGSTPSFLTWEEWAENAETALTKYYRQLVGDANPIALNLDSVLAFQNELGESDFRLAQAHNDPATLFVSPFSNLDPLRVSGSSPKPIAIIDIETGREKGRIQGVRSPFPNFCFLGAESEYLAVADALGLSSFAQVSVFDASTYKELTRLDTKFIYAEIAAIGLDEFIIRQSNFDFAMCRLESDGAHCSILEEESVHFPEATWKTSTVVGLKTTVGYVLSGGIPTKWYNRYIDVSGSFYRNGVVAWEAVRPPCLRVAQAEDPASVTEFPLKNPGGREWPFQLSTDGTKLITQSGPDSFQILRVALPKISVEQECRLKYDGDSNTLTLDRVKPVSAS